MSRREGGNTMYIPKIGLRMGLSKNHVSVRKVVNENRKTCGPIAKGRSCRERAWASLTLAALVNIIAGNYWYM